MQVTHRALRPPRRVVRPVAPPVNHGLLASCLSLMEDQRTAVRHGKAEQYSPLLNIKAINVQGTFAITIKNGWEKMGYVRGLTNCTSANNNTPLLKRK